MSDHSLIVAIQSEVVNVCGHRLPTEEVPESKTNVDTSVTLSGSTGTTDTARRWMMRLGATSL
jgi:hypothetical protein